MVDGHKSLKGGAQARDAVQTVAPEQRGSSGAVSPTDATHPTRGRVYRKCTCMWRPHNSSWRGAGRDELQRATCAGHPGLQHSFFLGGGLGLEVCRGSSRENFVEDPPEKKRFIFLVSPRSRDAYFVGALPDLSGSKLTVGQPGKKLHEVSMHR